MLAIPVIALLSSMIVFGERLSANEWAGIALIGIGLALIAALALAGGRRPASLLPADPTPLEGG
jgi:drug/metabolite transporter (DMT)-like permease